MQPPIAVFGTPGRYASALFSAASKAKALPTAQKELSEVLPVARLWLATHVQRRYHLRIIANCTDACVHSEVTAPRCQTSLLQPVCLLLPPHAHTTAREASADACVPGQVHKLAQDSADFGRFIKDPTISREQKAAVLESISSQMKLSELTSRFIGAAGRSRLWNCS